MKLKTDNLEHKYADVPLRVKTWVYIILVFVLAISHPLAMKIFISYIGFQVFLEFLRMFQIKINLIIASLGIGIAQFLLLFFLNFENYFLYALGISLLVIVLFLIRNSSLKQLSGIVLGLVIALFVFPHLVFLREGVLGVKALVFLVVVTELNDVFQYVMGKSFGKRKIMPKISPNKTWAGVVGGVFLTLILSAILGYFLLPSPLVVNIVLGLILGISGFFGDIFMSLLKRRTNVKDTGQLLPGHGGLLDRMDSLIFNLPIFFWVFTVWLKTNL
ncbi:phosphatidate cytidylyltransferase [Cellulophaga sp. E16_2]|uniref:phosphatidate cytidylyltransferase n=1 Tax=Cellulophaga sp. E16_2 TaxID=2789297 RepID=UPI001A91A255|nr:phosphatidate cytidylyltransferase [Cellulophaga sp. E16_2]MBO0593456.1 phosphatidate cytidylyltransferase [Cellulophaga sp. E16_2]